MLVKRFRAMSQFSPYPNYPVFPVLLIHSTNTMLAPGRYLTLKCIQGCAPEFLQTNPPLRFCFSHSAIQFYDYSRHLCTKC